MTDYVAVERVEQIQLGDLVVMAVTTGDFTSRPRILPIRSIVPLGCGHIRLSMPRPGVRSRERMSRTVEVTVRDDHFSADYCTCGAVQLHDLSVTHPLMQPLLDTSNLTEVGGR